MENNERKKRGRPRKNPETTSYYYAREVRNAAKSAIKLPPLATLEKVRDALGLDWDALAALLRVKMRTILYEWQATDALPNAAIKRLIKYARVNPEYLAGKSDALFSEAPTSERSTCDDAARVLSAFASALTDAEKKYACALARALNG